MSLKNEKKKLFVTIQIFLFGARQRICRLQFVISIRSIDLFLAEEMQVRRSI